MLQCLNILIQPNYKITREYFFKLYIIKKNVCCNECAAKFFQLLGAMEPPNLGLLGAQQ